MAGIVALSVAGLAQVATQAGKLSGTVRDSAGSSIPGVTVTARGPNGSVASVITGEYGGYSFDLSEGTYVIAAALPGFITAETTVSIRAGQVVDAPITLAVQPAPSGIPLNPGQQPPLTPFETYRVTANSQTRTGAIIAYRGDVRLLTSTTELRADELDFNTTTLSADARGNVSVRVIPAPVRVVPLGHPVRP